MNKMKTYISPFVQIVKLRSKGALLINSIKTLKVDATKFVDASDIEVKQNTYNVWDDDWTR